MSSSVSMSSLAQIHTSWYAEIRYSKMLALICMIWKKETKSMTESGLKEELNKVLEFVSTCKPQAVIVDTRSFVYPIDHSSQFWITSTFIPQVINEGVRKYAILVGEDKSAYINDEGSLEMDDFDLRYFNSADKALNWIIPDAG